MRSLDWPLSDDFRHPGPPILSANLDCMAEATHRSWSFADWLAPLDAYCACRALPRGPISAFAAGFPSGLSALLRLWTFSPIRLLTWLAESLNDPKIALTLSPYSPVVARRLASVGTPGNSRVNRSGLRRMPLRDLSAGHLLCPALLPTPGWCHCCASSDFHRLKLTGRPAALCSFLRPKPEAIPPHRAAALFRLLFRPEGLITLRLLAATTDQPCDFRLSVVGPFPSDTLGQAHASELPCGNSYPGLTAGTSRCLQRCPFRDCLEAQARAIQDIARSRW